jgi:hypothetical protein
MNIPRVLISAALSAIALAGITSTPAHADNGLLAWPKDKVYVQSNVNNSRWPVKSVAEVVDNNSPLNLVFVKRCPANSQCISVSTVRELPGARMGEANWWAYENNIVEATVKLDDTQGARYANTRQRRAIICHELLHAVGMEAHNGSNSSCLKQDVTNASSRPSAGDYRALNRRY